jgi:hypothetical protein
MIFLRNKRNFSYYKQQGSQSVVLVSSSTLAHAETNGCLVKNQVFFRKTGNTVATPPTLKEVNLSVEART